MPKEVINLLGTFGIKAIEGAWITARQIEAARIAATRYMKRRSTMDQNIPG
jgi:large subunit ribosomal protein L16